MSNRKIIILFLIFCCLNFLHGAEENLETTCNINAKKYIQCVSEKFISISVDPAVLLAGVNLSENSLRLAKRLSPAYIRIAGPSTKFLKYVDQDDKSENYLSADGNNVKISPAIWFGVTEWLKLAKLMPIFGINDAETARDLWNPKSTLPLFDLSEKLNVSCFWQLGFDSSGKNETRYKQDINILHYILTAYNGRNDTWKMIGSDISTMPTDRIETIMTDESDILEAVMWEPSGRSIESFPEKDTASKILLRQSTKPRAKIWTTVPKSKEPVSFASALLWAKQVGDAAKMGFDVVFRQPRIYELFTDTPIYWFSILHKELMGCHVLDAKSSIFQEETDIFAHCTRKQNSFVRRGAMTILMVNNRPNIYKVKVKVGNSLPEKSMEIQTYVLTSNSNNSTDIYLNGKLLTPKLLQQKTPFQPKIRRTKNTSHMMLSLPPSSIGFFVIPGARIPVCIEKEKETQLLLEEIEENQNNDLSEEIALQLGPRALFTRNNLLEEITQKLKDEMKSDEKYYKKSPTVLLQTKTDEIETKVDEKGRKIFIDRIKHKNKKSDTLKKFLLEKSRQTPTDQESKNMELTSEEMEKILKDRAIERAAKKNIVFTDEELEALIRKASKNFKPISKRSINMDLLNKHAQVNKEEAIQQFFLHPKDHKSRSERGVNLDLVDLKSRLAERRKLWQDKREELLGNTNSIKESLKDRIREIKSQFRIKRDINMDALKKNVKKTKKPKKSKPVVQNDEVEATIRRPGQSSDEILEQLKFADEDDDEVEDTIRGEVFAELADSEDLEDELILNNPPRPKKQKLLEKKQKFDPFAVAHPTIEVVQPSRRRNKKKKSKSDDKLQFLTTSEEFTDIEDDLPSIHEYYGVKNKKGNKKTAIKEINEFSDIPNLSKRDVSRLKRNADFTIIEIAKFQNNVPEEDDLQDLLFNPVLESPFLKALESAVHTETSKPPETTTLAQNITEIKEDLNEEAKMIVQDMENDLQQLVQLSINKEENDENTRQIEEIKDEDVALNETLNGDFEDLKKNDDSININNPYQIEPNQLYRKKREAENTENPEEPKKKKKKYTKKNSTIKEKPKHKSDKYLAEQLNLIKEKLQERKNEIDRIIKKQKEIEQDIKHQLKNKLSKKKAPKSKVSKRSIFSPRKTFGDYKPVDLRMWKPSDISTLKKDVRYTRNLIPPNDYPIFKNIFNNKYYNRKRRFIDSDADSLENEIDGFTNEVIKEKEVIEKINNYNKTIAVNTSDKSEGKTFIKDGDYKFKLPNNDEFEIIKAGDDTQIKFMHHDDTKYAEEVDDSIDVDNKTFTPEITPRSMKPFKEIEDFFGNIKKLFDKVGEEVKDYFSGIGLRI